MAEHTAHRDDLALMMKSMGQNVMDYMRGCTGHFESIVGPQRDFFIQLLLRDA